MSEFACHKCGRECPVAPAPPGKAVCEDCCDDHDYRYNSGMREHRCVHCDRPVPHDWYDD